MPVALQLRRFFGTSRAAAMLPSVVRRKARRRGRLARWLALAALAISAVAFGRAPESRRRGPPPTQQGPSRPERRREAPARTIPPAGTAAGASSPKRPAELHGTPFFASAEQCEQALHGRPRRSARATPRVGT